MQHCKNSILKIFIFLLAFSLATCGNEKNKKLELIYPELMELESLESLNLHKDSDIENQSSNFLQVINKKIKPIGRIGQLKEKYGFQIYVSSIGEDTIVFTTIKTLESSSIIDTIFFEKGWRLNAFRLLSNRSDSVLEFSLLKTKVELWNSKKRSINQIYNGGFFVSKEGQFIRNLEEKNHEMSFDLLPEISQQSGLYFDTSGYVSLHIKDGQKDGSKFFKVNIEEANGCRSNYYNFGDNFLEKNILEVGQPNELDYVKLLFDNSKPNIRMTLSLCSRGIEEYCNTCNVENILYKK